MIRQNICPREPGLLSTAGFFACNTGHLGENQISLQVDLMGMGKPDPLLLYKIYIHQWSLTKDQCGSEIVVVCKIVVDNYFDENGSSKRFTRWKSYRFLSNHSDVQTQPLHV